jgi:hypothetical protein
MIVCLGLAATVAAGDVWINCEAGLDIFLDGEPMGVSDKEEFGKHLGEVSAGEHTIRIKKAGVALAEFPIEVGYAANQVVVGALSARTSDVFLEGPGEFPEKKPVGTIIVTSDPRECTVKISGQHIPKIKPIMTFPNIPVGEHKIWFENSGTVLKETVRVQEAHPVKVMVEFRNQRVVITGAPQGPPEVESTVEDEEPPAAAACIEYWIEVLRTQHYDEIETYQQTLKDLGFPREHHKIITVEDEWVAPEYKLRVGPIERSKKAKWAAGLLRNAGLNTVWILPEECSPRSDRPKTKFKPTH